MREGIVFLGQAGFKINFGDKVIYIDPYLSNSVAASEGSDMNRLVDIPCSPENVKNANLLLISHSHQDHCDLETVLPLLDSSPDCRIMCPNEVKTLLVKECVPVERITIAEGAWVKIADDICVRSVPAAHPKIERDENNYLRYVGYLIQYKGRCIYHSGDTSPDNTITDDLKDITIDIAILPVNEKNYYRERLGIIGNMSIREAFQFADRIGAKTLIPMHWDMFAPNTVFKEEIELLYKLLSPTFSLFFAPRMDIGSCQ